RIPVLRGSDLAAPRWSLQSTHLRDRLAGVPTPHRAGPRRLAAIAPETASAAPDRRLRSVRTLRRPGAVWIQPDDGSEAARLGRHAARHRLLVSALCRYLAATRPTRRVSRRRAAAGFREWEQPCRQPPAAAT